jgi:hypothetical protein
VRRSGSFVGIIILLAFWALAPLDGTTWGPWFNQWGDDNGDFLQHLWHARAR